MNQQDLDVPELVLLDALNRTLNVTVAALRAAHSSDHKRSHAAQLADAIVDLAKALQSISACYRKALRHLRACQKSNS